MKKKGETDSALKYLKFTINIKDSLFNIEKANSIQNLVLYEQEKQKEIEASQLKYKNQLRTY